MYYMISMQYLPDAIFKEVQSYLPIERNGFLFIERNGLRLYVSYTLSLNEGYETINIDKLKEILVLKRLKE